MTQYSNESDGTGVAIMAIGGFVWYFWAYWPVMAIAVVIVLLIAMGCSHSMHYSEERDRETIPTIDIGQRFPDVPTFDILDVSEGIALGQRYDTGEFFWIKNAIGLTQAAKHFHERCLSDTSSHAGSVGIGCEVRILELEDGMATVQLYRPSIPIGASAPTGTIFRISVEKILSWQGQLENYVTALCNEEKDIRMWEVG